MTIFYTKETFYMKMENKYHIMGSINQNKCKETNTLHSTYLIIKDPCNEKQVNITYQVMGRQQITQNIIHQNLSRKIYSNTY